MVLAYDGRDEGALERRLAAREEHLNLAREMAANGTWLMGTAILDDEGRMIGSMIICDYPSRADLDAWLENEPYVLGEVWQKIKIERAQVAPFWS